MLPKRKIRQLLLVIGERPSKTRSIDAIATSMFLTRVCVNLEDPNVLVISMVMIGRILHVQSLKYFSKEQKMMFSCFLTQVKLTRKLLNQTKINGKWVSLNSSQIKCTVKLSQLITTKITFRLRRYIRSKTSLSRKSSKIDLSASASQTLRSLGGQQ